jgi:hypothetical protein
MGKLVSALQEKGPIWYTYRSKFRTGTEAGVYGWGMKKIISFSLGQ